MKLRIDSDFRNLCLGFNISWDHLPGVSVGILFWVLILEWRRNAR